MKILRKLIAWWDAKQVQWYQEARAEIHEKTLARHKKGK